MSCDKAAEVELTWPCQYPVYRRVDEYWADEPAWVASATRPANQPGARPPAGGCMAWTSSPLRASSHAMIELEFHISSTPCGRRPHTPVGTCGTRSSNLRTRCGSVLIWRGLSTASVISGDGSVTPATDLVAEGREPAEPGESHWAFGHDTLVSSLEVPGRRLLDDVTLAAQVDLERAVVEIGPFSVLVAGGDGFEEAAVPADEVTAST
jgi:hypothetical protein